MGEGLFGNCEFPRGSLCCCAPHRGFIYPKGTATKGPRTWRWALMADSQAGASGSTKPGEGGVRGHLYCMQGVKLSQSLRPSSFFHFYPNGAKLQSHAGPSLPEPVPGARSLSLPALPSLHPRSLQHPLCL